MKCLQSDSCRERGLTPFPLRDELGLVKISAKRTELFFEPTNRPVCAKKTLLPPELDAFFQEFLVTVGVDIVLGADVFLQPRAFAQHER